VTKQVATLHGIECTETPVVRRSPDRLIVQLGAVALSVAWLRGAVEGVADGELLIVVWRGSVGPGKSPAPERAHAAPQTTATVVWEDVLSVVAETAEGWRWSSGQTPRAEFTSEELAARCVAQLRLALVAARQAV
jgi:hypothetical protein